MTIAQRRLNFEQGLGSARISGHEPTPEFLADIEAAIAGTMTDKEAMAASLARALASDKDTATVEQPLEVPLHVHVEVMLEELALIRARLRGMELAEKSARKRKILAEARIALRNLGHQFDPYNKDEVMAMVRRVSQYAKAFASQT